MDSIIIIITSIITFIVSTLIFRKVSGGDLSLKNINLISLAYYSLLIFSFIGSILFGLNIDGHYRSNNMQFEDTKFIGWVIVQLVMILFPLNISFVYKLFNFKNISLYTNYKNSEVIDKHYKGKYIYYGVLIITFFIMGGLIYTVKNIGISNIPIFKMITGSSAFDLAQSRISVNVNFTGNIYIRNILAFNLAPLLSLIAYIYYKITRKKEWRNLFVVLFLMASFVKIYDLQKAPLLIYLLTFFVTEVYLGTKISNKLIYKVGFLSSISMIFMYLFVSKYPLSKIFTFKTGPINRALLSQIAGFFLHIDIFPKRHAYLKGASFPRIISERLLNLSHERSARTVMKIVNIKGIRDGTAGVMNTLFVGEAYANFGYLGIVLSILYVSLLFAIVFMVFIKLPKTPLNVALFAYLSISLTMTLQGGFVDYIYNILNIILILLIIFIEKFAQRIQKL